MTQGKATDMPAAVLVGMGGPSSPSDVAPFMRNLFSDPRILPLPAAVRGPLASFIVRRRSARARERYRILGGSSPIHAYTEEQVRMLARELGDGFVVRHAFRYTSPRAGEVAGELADLGIRRLVALSTYPQRSFTTTDSSMDELAAEAANRGIEVKKVTSYATDAAFVAALGGSLCATLAEAGPGARVVMTAHSIPTRNVRRGDPYVAEVHATARALARTIPQGVPWELAFQSRVGPVGWVGPGLDRTLARLGREGVSKVVVAPLSFSSEHLETMLELDLEMREKAAVAGIGGYYRMPVPGLDPGFIRMLARLARREVARG